jgi:hypothetical protein
MTYLLFYIVVDLSWKAPASAGDGQNDLLLILRIGFQSSIEFKNASAFLPRRAWCEAPSFLRGCDPPEAFISVGD